MNIMTYEDFKTTEDYQEFIDRNSSTGTLKVKAFTAYQAIPIPNTEILVTKDIEDNRVLFFRGFTDESGIIKNIELPAPPEDTNPTPDTEPQYTVYDLTAIHEGYETIKKYNIGIFGNIGVIQYVKMIPQVEIEGKNTNGD